jgi:hypothetical protein
LRPTRQPARDVYLAEPKSAGTVADEAFACVQDTVAEISAEQRDRQVRGRHGHPAVGRQTVVGDAAVALSLVRLGDAQ